VSRELTWLALPILAVAGSAIWQARANAQVERRLEQLISRLDHAEGQKSSPPRCVASLDSALLRQEVSRALSGACPGAIAQLPTAAPAIPPPAASGTRDQPEANVVRSDATIKAFDDANKLIDDAIGRHAWRPEDVQALRDAMPALAAQDRSDVVRRLVQAVNDQKLTVTGEHHSLF